MPDSACEYRQEAAQQPHTWSALTPDKELYCGIIEDESTTGTAFCISDNGTSAEGHMNIEHCSYGHREEYHILTNAINVAPKSFLRLPFRRDLSGLM